MSAEQTAVSRALHTRVPHLFRAPCGRVTTQWANRRAPRVQSNPLTVLRNHARSLRLRLHLFTPSPISLLHPPPPQLHARRKHPILRREFLRNQYHLLQLFVARQIAVQVGDDPVIKRPDLGMSD